jgi:cell division protein FtsL
MQCVTYLHKVFYTLFLHFTHYLSNRLLYVQSNYYCIETTFLEIKSLFNKIKAVNFFD